MLEMCWSFDERINDGFYCALALKAFARVMEDPEKHIGPPGAPPEAAAPADAPRPPPGKP
jgi:hypothetical protein